MELNAASQFSRYSVLLLLNFLLSYSEAVASESVSYSRQVRPLLSEKCFTCHGPDNESRQGGFRLDLPESAFGEADSGERPIVPGDPNASELLKRVSFEDESMRMPPTESNRSPLTPDEIQTIRSWIAQGAKYEKHWAFEQPRTPAVPTTLPSWCRNPVDYFILERLKREGLQPSEEADKQTLIRRLSLDLTGLPPSPEEVDAFLADDSENAYEALVDRLFASPHYGERMAIQWLDAARYSDTNGYQQDYNRFMWRWRDWVIDAYNRNVSFDQFTKMQLAGDLKEDPKLEDLIATGFNRNHRINSENGAIPEEWRVEYVVDRLETFGTVWLGLTIGCARCHDHKFDPISQREFYQLFSFFNNVKETGVAEESDTNTPPLIPAPRPDEKQRLETLDRILEVATAEVEEISCRIPELLATWEGSIQEVPIISLESPSPVIHFPLDGDLLGSGSGYESLQSKIVPGSSPIWTLGLIGKALSLNSANELEIRIEMKEKLCTRDAFSFGCWVRVKDSSGTILGWVGEEEDSRGVELAVSDTGHLEARFIQFWPGNVCEVCTLEKVPLASWNHVMVTSDGSSTAGGVKFYLNGESLPLKTLNNSLSGPITTDQPLRIGKLSHSGFPDGAISELRVYDCQLTEEQVKAIHDSTLTPLLHIPREQRTEDQALALTRIFRTRFCKEAQERDNAMKEAQLQWDEYLKSVPTVMVMKELDQPRQAYILNRGQYDQRGDPVDPAVPSALHAFPAEQPLNRMGLAEWVVSDENPLTARVTVNRLWEQVFGIGLVKTLQDFGSQGEQPVNQELLDWLATEFVSSGWNVKEVMKLLVTSSTYRQSSVVKKKSLALDPENRLLSRGPRYRLQAELIRDQALAVSGLLVNQLGGPSVKPYQPEGLWSELSGSPDRRYVLDEGAGLYRRSLYTYSRRTIPHPTMTTFDAPSREYCAVQRSRTNTPLQALALLNDTTYVESARKLAERVLAGSDVSDAQRIRMLFQFTLARNPADSEVEIVKKSLTRRREYYRNHPDQAQALLEVGKSGKGTLDQLELAAYSTTAGILLNLDEFVTKQ